MGIDPISVAVLIGVGLWILAAPDPITASFRSGAASAIGSGAYAARQSVRAEMAISAKRRSDQHRARLDRWRNSGTRSDRIKLALDRFFGRGGVVESGGRRIGTHLEAAWVSGRAGWRSGKQRGRRGLPDRLHRRVAPIASRIRSRARHAKAVATGTTPTSSRPGKPAGQSTPRPTAGPNGGNNPVPKTAQPINTEAGLLPVAEQIVAATAELAALIEAAEASANMSESLRFDPGEEVKQAMSVLADAAPSPDSLRAYAEAATGFKTALEEHITAVVGA